jgi:hypothetical protein
LDSLFLCPIICMIYIEKNILTNIALTLTESSQLATPYYLFHFVNEINDTEFFETFTDISGYPERFNLFEMQLDYVAGQYTYTVYESDTPNPTTIADTTGRIIETGIMIVHSTENVDTNIYL